jgi:hypothetical protein
LGRIFTGSKLDGVGFAIEPEEAQSLIQKDPKSKAVLFPYLGGKDLNSRFDQFPTRWVINFSDWEFEEVEKYPDCLELVRERVYPTRQKHREKRTREHWWQFQRARPELYRTITPLQRVLVTTLHSKYLCFSFVSPDMVYSHALAVCALEGGADFTILQSTIHEVWARKHASTLKTDLRYTPSDIFETFPFPQSPIPNPQSLTTTGETYHEHRRQVMLARQQGLTKTYNRFHDPACHDADVVELRRLHVEMDRAVLAAYGWDDLTLDHDFRGAGKEARYTLGAGVKEELLRRLLLLNFEIAAREEAEGATKADKPQPRRRTRRSKRKKKDERQLSLFED